VKEGITSQLVECLIGEQFPEWSHLAVAPVELDGNDNTTFRLGEGLSARLPSADAYVAQVEKEHEWLPKLAPLLPLAIPEPLARGGPGCGFQRPWSVYRWLDGTIATVDRIDDLPRFAADLAAFLSALYTIDPAGGPAAGAHSFFRGGPIETLDGDVRSATAALASQIDTHAVTAAWDAALDAAWPGPDVWVHGDITSTNLLVAEGRLAAVIDFGCCAVGDPACDLAITWTLFEGESRRAFREGLRLDDDTWSRGRGWALWKALITLTKPEDEAERRRARFGWRIGAREVIEEITRESTVAP
jgi:aminoglycoside phosphotransferase (APT) family kinase protein